jgi:molecular chaperone DnaK
LVTASSGLSEQEVESLVAEAAANSDADQHRRQLIDLRNQVDGLVYSTERTLEEFKENVSDDQRSKLLAAVETAREAAVGEDIDALRAAMQQLSTDTYEMTEHLYAELGGSSEATAEE